MDDAYLEELKVLSYIRIKCYEDSSFLTKVIQTGVSGIQNYAENQAERAADMETFASAMAFMQKQERISPKLKKEMNNLALSKLEKWLDKTSLKWNDNIQKE